MWTSTCRLLSLSLGIFQYLRICICLIQVGQFSANSKISFFSLHHIYYQLLSYITLPNFCQIYKNITNHLKIGEKPSVYTSHSNPPTQTSAIAGTLCPYLESRLSLPELHIWLCSTPILLLSNFCVYSNKIYLHSFDSLAVFR